MHTGISAIALLSLLLQGCLLLPHSQHKTPTVEGQITLSGQAAANVEVSLFRSAGEHACSGEKHSTVTAPDGAFKLKPFKQFSLLVVSMAHCHMPWSLCVSSDSYSGVLIENVDYTLCSPGLKGTVEVFCELNTNKQNRCQSPHLPPYVLGDT